MIKKINNIEPKEEKNVEQWINICWLMSDPGKEHAIALQLENLILTYGYAAIKKQLEKSKVSLKKSA